MTWQEIGQTFLRFFEERDHVIVPSASLVPAGDPTLLFVNAGMVPFKNVFLGLEQRPYTRAVSIQKCLRVSGHHNDLETVGPSPRHHTFFQMCGNFAFGAYFKREAIHYAWELVTGVYGIDPNRLVFTVFETDDESFHAWRGLGIPEERIFRLGEKTNFWMMGDVGPVGPNAELHYDWGPEACTCRRSDCSVALDNDCGRWLEIWNLVFMQYNQAADRSRAPLARPGVDTGMGLERMTAVLQGTPSNFDTDLFIPLMERIQQLAGHSVAQRAEAVVAYRVIADHTRAAAFLMADGVMPGNEGRPYVLRMIMRRAMRFGRRIGLDRPFLAEVTDTVAGAMGEMYPDLLARGEVIHRGVRAEEDRFGQTLSLGLGRLDEAIADVRERGSTTLPGEVVFRLYDTFGFPVEMTRDVAHEQGLSVDEQGFALALAAQRERARAARGTGLEGAGAERTDALTAAPPTEFIGYRALAGRARVAMALHEGLPVQKAEEGEEVDVVLDRSPFYAEGGGQVGDQGRLVSRRVEVHVADAQRPVEGVIVHRARVARGMLRAGDQVRAEVDTARRRDIMRNHTATHLLHRALRDSLGEHAAQAGSLVAPDRLRFDFTHVSALADEERRRIEAQVNEKIAQGLPVRARWMGYDEALRRGATALFGEKYGDRVRVVEIGTYSRELCGGTHLTDTAQIGLFKIVAEGSAAAGIRRMEAVTGRGAYAYLLGREAVVDELAEILRVAPGEVVGRVRRVLEQQRQQERELAALQAVARTQDVDTIVGAARRIGEARIVTARLDGLSHEGLRRFGDAVRDRLESGVLVLGGAQNGRVNLIAMATPDLIARGVRADAIIRRIAASVGGSGGGRPDMAQAGGRDVEALDGALASAADLVAGQLAPQD